MNHLHGLWPLCIFSSVDDRCCTSKREYYFFLKVENLIRIVGKLEFSFLVQNFDEQCYCYKYLFNEILFDVAIFIPLELKLE